MRGKSKAIRKAPATAGRINAQAGGTMAAAGKTPPAANPAPAQSMRTLRRMPMGREAGSRARDVRAMHGAVGARRTAQLIRAGPSQPDEAMAQRAMRMGGAEPDETMRVQPKLEVGPPDDAYEREADATAQRVMRMGGGACCPSCAEGKECEVRPARVQPVAKTVPGAAGPQIRRASPGDENCPGHERGEVARSRSDAGHLPTDIEVARGKLIVADFGIGRSEVKEIVQRDPLLQLWLDRFEQDPSYRLSIVGYSDCVGSADRNIELRHARAKSVETLLGTDARGRVSFIGMAALGSYRADNATASGRALNRAVVVRFHQEMAFPAEPITAPVPATCPREWTATVSADHTRALNMMDVARGKLRRYDGTDPPEVKSALARHFKADSTTFAGWVNFNLGFLRAAARLADYECADRSSWWCGSNTLAKTFWCVPLVDIRVCWPLYFSQSDKERSATLIHEWVHKYGCNFDLGYSHEPDYPSQWTITALLNADPFAEFVKDVQ